MCVSIIELLRQLCSRVCWESWTDFQGLVSLYEHLLSPHEDANTSVQCNLLDIRAKLLSPGQDSYVNNAADRVDCLVERCVSIDHQQSTEAAAFPVDGILRLLIALSGGEDGNTFGLKDIMRCEKKRFGGLNGMSGTDVVQEIKSLFQQTPLPLEDKSLYMQTLQGNVGDSISIQHSCLWCPHFSVFDDRLSFDVITLKQKNCVFGLPDSPLIQHDSIYELTTPVSLKRHYCGQTVDTRCKGPTRQNKWSSIKENSSLEFGCSLNFGETWIVQSYAWEGLKDIDRLPESYAKIPSKKKNWSPRNLVIPIGDAFVDAPHLEIHEEDLIQDSLRVLSGVGSTIYQWNHQTATFELPRMRRIKLSNTSVSATTSILEVFRRAGTMIMRIELIATYYFQDAFREGKMLQRTGEALQLYLTAHRNLVEALAKQCLESSSSENYQKSARISIANLLCKSRKLCHVAQTIGTIFGCDADIFRPLLQSDKLPQGVELLDNLFNSVTSLSVEDSSGCMHELVTRIFVESCSPLLASVSRLNLAGSVDESNPCHEFEATTWSRNMLAITAQGGGDGLIESDLLTEVTEMLPKFLNDMAPVIFHLCQTRAIVQSMNASLTHSLATRTRKHAFSGCLEMWKQKVDCSMILLDNTFCLDCARTEKIISSEISADRLGQNFNFEDAEEKRSSCSERRKIDRQVPKLKQHQLQQIHQEAPGGAKRLKDKAIVDQSYGHELLVKKFSVLMKKAEERRNYMRWRRNRAVRLSTAKEQLKWRRAKDIAIWASGARIDFTGKDKFLLANLMTGVVPTVKGTTFKRIASLNSKHKTSIYSIMTSDEEIRKALEKAQIISRSGTSATLDNDVERVSNIVMREVSEPRLGDIHDSFIDEMALREMENIIRNLARENDADVLPESFDASTLENQNAKAGGTIAVHDDIEMVHSLAVMDEPLFNALASTRHEKIVYDDNAMHIISEEEGFMSQSSKYGDAQLSNTTVASISAKSARLPPVHPLFSMANKANESELLKKALIGTASTAELNLLKPVTDCLINIPIRLAAKQLEQLAVMWLRNSLQVHEQFRWLRKLMLLSERLFMDIFARDFLVNMKSFSCGTSGIRKCLSFALNSAMVDYSVTLGAIVHAFHYKSTSEVSQSSGGLSLIDEIEIVYDVRWPLGCLITTHLLDRYKQIHQFLLRVRLTSLELRETWATIRIVCKKKQLSSSLERLCGGILYMINACLRAYNETFATTVFMVAWSDFKNAIQNATSLYEMRHCHENYVFIALRCCFLAGPALAIHSAFLDILTATWDLAKFIRSLKKHVVKAALREIQMRTLYRKADVALRLFIKKLHSVPCDTEQCTRNFFDCLLIRLSMNQYYSKDSRQAGSTTIVEF